MVQVTKTVSIQNHLETLLNFMNAGGQFLVLSREEKKFRVFRNALMTAIKDTKIRCSWMARAEASVLIEQLADYIENSQDIFLVMDENKFKDYKVLEEIRGRFGKEALPVLVLTQEIGEAQINYFLEVGASNILVVPYSPVNLIEKISFILKPGQIGQIIDKGRELSAQKKYEEALAVCDIILKHKPGSAAALMLKGDVYKARALDGTPDEAKADKETAKSCYLQAWEANKKYLEPLKRLVDICKSYGITDAYLSYVKELDQLSPLNIERKMEIGRILLEKADVEEASRYFDEALNLLKQDPENTAEQIREMKNRIRALLKDKTQE